MECEFVAKRVRKDEPVYGNMSDDNCALPDYSDYGDMCDENREVLKLLLDGTAAIVNYIDMMDFFNTDIFEERKKSGNDDKRLSPTEMNLYIPRFTIDNNDKEAIKKVLQRDVVCNNEILNSYRHVVVGKAKGAPIINGNPVISVEDIVYHLDCNQRIRLIALFAASKSFILDLKVTPRGILSSFSGNSLDYYFRKANDVFGNPVNHGNMMGSYELMGGYEFDIAYEVLFEIRTRALELGDMNWHAEAFSNIFEWYFGIQYWTPTDDIIDSIHEKERNLGQSLVEKQNEIMKNYNAYLSNKYYDLWSYVEDEFDYNRQVSEDLDICQKEINYVIEIQNRNNHWLWKLKNRMHRMTKINSHIIR